jgi:hypothetical protein
MVLLPIVFFPFSRTIWIALGLTFRPAERRDETSSDGEGSPEGRR